MKKKYLYNGQLMELADIQDAAKQSNIDVNAYIQKAGIREVEDNYSFNGKTFSAKDILDAANQSNLGFDDYIQKAGFSIGEKKNLSESGTPTESKPLSTQSVPTTLQSGLAGNTNEFNPLKDIVSIQTTDDLGNPIIQQSNGSILSINPKTIPITPLANQKAYVSDLQKRIKSGSLTKQDEKVISENQKGNHNFDVADETELIDLVNKYDPQTSQLLNLPIPSILSNLLPDLQGKTFGEALNTTDGKLAATKLLKEKVYENFNKQYEGAESVPDLDEGSKKELARLSELEIKLGFEKNKSDTYTTFVEATVRKDESGNIWNRFKNRVLLLSPITAVQGMLGISAETEDKIQKLPDGFSIGLNGLKYTEPVEHERVINSLLKGEPISESQVGQITMQGLEAKEAMAKDAYVDKTISKEQYTNQINEIQKDRYNAILDNKEITRAFLSNGIANLADDINSEIPSVTGSLDVAKKVFGHTWNYTDAQIEQYGKAVAQANGLDPNDARVKDAIKYLQDNEGWMITENSIAKAGFARDFAKGLASPIRGISATLEDIGKSTSEVYAESQSQGNVNVAEQKLKRVENSWEGAVSDILEGTGQFVTQAGLSLGISGAIGAAGRGILGRAGIAALQGDIALADMAATDLVGKALLSSKDAIATFITAGAQSYDGNLKQALSYTSDDNIARNVAKGMSGLEGATELFLSPITVARGIAKNLFNKATTTKGLVNILSDAAIVDKNSAVKNFLKSTLKVVGTEIGEEEVVAIADYTANSILNPNSKRFADRDLMNEMSNTAYQTGLSMVLPALASGVGVANVNNFSKGSLLIAAQNRQQMLDDLNKRLFDGDMSQDEYNEKAAIINTASVANETLPLKENGQKLNSEEKADYIFSRVSEGILKKRSEQSEDEAEKIILDKKIKEQQNFRVGLLGVKEVVPEPILEEKVTVNEPIVTDAKTLLQQARDNKQLGVYENVPDEQLLKEIAKQAQNVQEDGTVSTLATPEQAKQSAINQFKSKELVDAAIALHPLESLVTTTETVPTPSPTVDKVEGELNDVESTTKALDKIEKDNPSKINELSKISGFEPTELDTNEKIAKEYHEAKNLIDDIRLPEQKLLVKAVEQSLSPKEVVKVEDKPLPNPTVDSGVVVSDIEKRLFHEDGDLYNKIEDINKQLSSEGVVVETNSFPRDLDKMKTAFKPIIDEIKKATGKSTITLYRSETKGQDRTPNATSWTTQPFVAEAFNNRPNLEGDRTNNYEIIKKEIPLDDVIAVRNTIYGEGFFTSERSSQYEFIVENKKSVEQKQSENTPIQNEQAANQQANTENKQSNVKAVETQPTDKGVDKVSQQAEEDIAKEKRIADFNKKADNVGKSIIDFLTPAHTKGIKKSGLGVEEIVNAAISAIKKANEAGENIKAAIETAIKYIKDNLGNDWNDAYEQPLRAKFDEISKEGIGISNAQTEKIREKYKLGNYERNNATDAELEAAADEAIKNGYNIETLLSQLENLIPPTGVENFILKKYIAGLEAKFEKNPTDANLAPIERVVKAVDKIGSIQSEAFRTRRGIVPVDDSLAGYFITEKESAQVDTLTDGQKTMIEKEYNDIKDAEAKWNIEKEKLNAKIIALQAQKELNKIKPVKKENKTTPKTHDDFVSQRDKLREKLKQQIADYKSAGNKLGIASDGGVESFIITAKMANTIGQIVRSHVDEIGTKLAEVTKRTFDDVKDLFDGITEKDIHNVIAGNYNAPQKTKSQTAKDLFELRMEAKLVNQLIDLENGKEPTVEKKKIERNRQIKELREKIAKFRKENITDAQKLKALKTRYASEIKKVEEDLKTGNFLTPQPPPPKVALDKEGLAAKDKLVKLKMERQLRLIKQQQENMSKRDKAIKGVAEILNIPRTLMTIVDYSAVLRQGLIQTISHPQLVLNARIEDGRLKVGGAGIDMFKAGVSQKVYDRWFFDLKETPRFDLIEKSGLAVTDSTNPLLTAREEGFMSNLAEKIPIIGKTLNIGKVKIPGTNLVKGSERSYSMFINKLRVDVFNRFADAMEERGLSFENSPEAFKQMAEYVNNSTGRGSLGKSLNKIAPLLNGLLFSPRLIASRLNMLTYLAQPRFYKTVPIEVRKAYFKDMAKFIGLGMTVLSLFALNGEDEDDDEKNITVDADPRSSDFGKIRQGNTRWDIWGGFQQFIRVSAQVLSGERKSTKTGDIYDLSGEGAFGSTRTDVGLAFLRGKLAPVPAMAIDLFSRRTPIGDKVLLTEFGKDNEGEKEITIDRYLKEHLLPLTITGTIEAMKEKGVKGLFTVGIPSVFGVGTQTYE